MHIHKAQRQGGFTLVELAVVLLIIGLIVGGILRGQELITSAQINAVQTDANQIRTSFNTFQDKFVALPGDIGDATLIDDSGSSVDLVAADSGNGDGRIDGNRTNDGTEPVLAWIHLGASGLLGKVDEGDLEGSDLDGTNGFQGSVGGFYSLGQGLSGSFQDVSEGDIWLILGSGSGGANDTPIVDASQAAQLDRKVDDGDPANGNLRGDTANTGTGNGSGCMTAAPGNDPAPDYNNEGGSCALALEL